MNSDTLTVLPIVGGLSSIALLAYNWGWQAGHDVHHADDNPTPIPPEPPEPPKTLYI